PFLLGHGLRPRKKLRSNQRAASPSASITVEGSNGRSSMHSVLRHVRRAALSDPEGLSDAQLLGAFLGGEDAAFEGILRRHGPMVFGVCQRVLRDAHLAE